MPPIAAAVIAIRLGRMFLAWMRYRRGLVIRQSSATSSQKTSAFGLTPPTWTREVEKLLDRCEGDAVLRCGHATLPQATAASTPTPVRGSPFLLPLTTHVDTGMTGGTTSQPLQPVHRLWVAIQVDILCTRNSRGARGSRHTIWLWAHQRFCRRRPGCALAPDGFVGGERLPDNDLAGPPVLSVTLPPADCQLIEGGEELIHIGHAAEERKRRGCSR